MRSKEVYFSFLAVKEAQVSRNYIEVLMLILKQPYKQEIFRPMTLTADIQETFEIIWNGKGSTGRFWVVFLFCFKKTSFMRRYTDKGRLRFVL